MGNALDGIPFLMSDFSLLILQEIYQEQTCTAVPESNRGPSLPIAFGNGNYKERSCKGIFML